MLGFLKIVVRNYVWILELVKDLQLGMILARTTRRQAKAAPMVLSVSKRRSQQHLMLG
jgi:hypothetical protein